MSDYEIVATFNAEMRGFANYYALAPKENLHILEWAGVSSLFLTLASKHKCSPAKMRKQMKDHDEHVLRDKSGDRSTALAVFKIKHRAPPTPDLIDREPKLTAFWGRTEITQRMQAKRCEYCGTRGGYFEVHHIRKMKDLADKKSKTPFDVLMLARKRKTMVLCVECHRLLHAGKLQGWKRGHYAEVESAVR